MIRFRSAALLLALLLALITAGACAAGTFKARYYYFDRAVWSADSRAVAVIGRFIDEDEHTSLDDTLLVNVASGEITCLSPTIYKMVLNRTGDRILGMSRWGLFEHDVRTGRTRQLLYQNPFRASEVVDFSYRRDGAAALVIRCVDWDTDSSGVWSYPLDGSAPTLDLADPSCGPPSLNYWQVHRRAIIPPPDHVPGVKVPAIIPGFPGTVWQTRRDDIPRVEVWGNGPARDSVLCADCRPVFVSWPDQGGGGQALVATGPPDIRDLISGGGLWLLKPNQPPSLITRRLFLQIVWPDSTFAFLSEGVGHLWVADLTSGAAHPVNTSMTPGWTHRPPLAEPAAWTVTLPGAFADLDTARTVALGYRDRGVTGYAVDSLGAGRELSLALGVWPDSAAAVKAARQILGDAAGVPPRVTRRRPEQLLGSYDLEGPKSPDGKWQLLFRSHPHMFMPCAATEVWVRPVGGGRPRLIMEAVANF